MNMDEIIKAADPARTVDIPHPDSQVANRILERILEENSGHRNIQAPANAGNFRAKWEIGLGAAAAVAVVFILLIVGVVPSPFFSTQRAGASELSVIASNAARQPHVTLKPGEYLYQKMTASLQVSLSPSGSPGEAGRDSASIGATLESWVGSFGVLKYRDTFRSAQFPTEADRSAWTSAGFSVSPVLAQPDVGTTLAERSGGTIGGNYAPGFGALDVSKLPTDSKVLASELASGKTGIVALDGLSSTELGGANIGEFDRAVLLLLGPDLGATPSLYSAVYSVLNEIPGMHQLGVVTDHSGRAGQGFALESPGGRQVIIVNPATGQLLELQGLSSQL
ncbi:MAG TPA: hypothetical protein VMU77_07705, partial [Acidimicrobiales bacterium]|nr:hypothetical protein [Acidimicrobiales bacterium]